MATLRQYHSMPATLSKSARKLDRRRKSPADRKAVSMTVNFTEAEYLALVKYKDLKLQPSDAAAIRAAVLLELRGAGLLPAD